MCIILNVTDEQLLASKYVTLLFIVILSFAILLNIYRLLKKKNRPLKGKIISVFLVVACAAGIIYAFSRFKIENSLLHESTYITGTTKGFCDVALKGSGIEYEYEMNRKKYTACITFHPIPKEKIVVPDGKYKVRISEKFPAEGRMDFNQPAE